jgi:hypothetical protein
MPGYLTLKQIIAHRGGATSINGATEYRAAEIFALNGLFQHLTFASTRFRAVNRNVMDDTI